MFISSFYNHIGTVTQMGKTTLYHPVSLYVIRASLISCGIVPDRIRQLHVETEIGQAVYSTSMSKLPKEIRYLSSPKLLLALQDCFAADVVIVSVADTYNRVDEGRKITIVFRTFLNAPPIERDSLENPEPYHGHDSDHDAPQDLQWLSDEEARPDVLMEIHRGGTFGENSGDFIPF